MKNSIKSVSVVVLCAFMTACSPSKEKMNAQISLMENETAQTYDLSKMDSLVSLYQQYVKEFPQDSMTQEYLFRSGKLNITLRKGTEALTDFNTLIKNFPQCDALPEVYYYVAYVYEDILYDIASARTAYYDFINRYPSHRLVRDATLAIQYLGKSPEEIISSFEHQEDTTSIE
jgi:outer membrane protein assembly factor BamD (BamD/ComL family)